MEALKLRQEISDLIVVSWNVHRCIGSDGHYEPERIARILSTLDADIIALQEVDSSLHAAGEVDQLSAIANQLGMTSVMGPTLAREYGVYGNALLFKTQPKAIEEHDLSYRKFEPRGALAAEIEHGGFSIRIVNTHLGLKYWERAVQIDKLLAELTWRDHDVTFLLGDFNEWFPYTPNTLRLVRSFPRTRRLATFPSVWPRFALDRIFVSGRASISEIIALSGLEIAAASDHLPLVARVSMSQSSSQALS